uniref:Par3_HAL_N_term domain-containing protein n=1 Tax=Anopheles merus TaxID=30066 RepID=A0A182UMR8_ANOME
MKVTVCFGETRFVVPCPPGTTVQKLEQEAILRYKRKVSIDLDADTGLLSLQPRNREGFPSEQPQKDVLQYDP